jgi:hypothetical protein
MRSRSSTPGPLLACAGALLALAAPALAQRQARAFRTDDPPVIDGRLDDAAWGQAEPIGEFLQVVPVEGAEPSERSDFRILFDADHLYIGIRFYDRDPDAIIATTHERDARLEADDRVEIVLDTFHDKRNAFFFQLNAAGSKGDALITENGRDFNKPWDGIWEGKARIDDQGWVAEMAIPFKTLNFEEGLGTWGLNALRYIGRRNERNRWASASQDDRLFNISEAGELTGLEGMRQGVGLDVVPFFVSNYTRDRTGGGDSDLEGEPGVDIFYKLTPSLNLSLTVNTDFAETEVDERRINLTRFPLFFPERRDFFLQDSGLFSFGSSRGRFRPFFSRRIGLSDGEVVPLRGGVKLSGRQKDYNIGLLDVVTDSVTDESGNVTDGENLFVSRISRNVGEQSTVGFIVTDGSPDAPEENTVFGFDANYRTSSFRGDKNLTAGIWALKSDTDGVEGDDSAFGASLRYPNDRWSWFVDVREIQKDFEAALGFVPREDIREYSGGITFEPRIGTDIRQLEFSADIEVVTDTDDVLETVEAEVQPFGIIFESGDAFRVELEQVHDELDEDFEISDGVVVTVDEYDWTRWRLEFDSAEKRSLSTSMTLGGGSFYDGDRMDYRLGLEYRTGPLFTGEVEYIQNDIDLDGGDFTTQISRVRTKFSFSPDLSWNTFVQWDNVSESIGINSRLRFIPSPGHEVNLVVNETLDEEDSSLTQIETNVALKVSYTVRF